MSRAPSLETLLRYVAGTLPADEAERVMAHVAADDTTFARVQGLELVRREFDAFWAAFEASVARAGGEASPVTSASLVLAVRGLLDGARGLATAAGDLVARASDAMAGAFDVSPAPVFGGTASPEEIAVQSLAHEASARLGEGADADARARLDEVRARDPRVAGVFALDVLHDGQVVGRVEVDAGSRTVTVTVEPDVARAHPVAALSVTGEEAPREVAFGIDDAGEGRRAVFHDVPDGVFRLELLPAG